MMDSRLLSASHLEDQPLLFGDDFPAPDPKMGITLYGPYSEHPRQIPIGIIGGPETVDQVRRLLEMCQSEIPGDAEYPLWKQDFPGMNADAGLRCELLIKSEWCESFTHDEIASFDRIPTREDRVKQGVDIFCDRIEKLQEREDRPEVFICAPPRRVMDLCIPQEGGLHGGRKGTKSKAEKKTPDSAFDPQQRKMWEFAPDIEKAKDEILESRASDNFHNLLKARAMRLDAPTQFMKPYTLDKLFGREEGHLQHPATICWNLTVALYYKAGGSPWRLQTLPAGTCFVGIAFYREKVRDTLGTSLAQVFTPDGEGLVLKGERFDWPKGKAPHLPQDSAQRIIKRVVDAYQKQTGTFPERVVVHKTSRFNDPEKAGMNQALEGVPRHDFLTIYDKGRRIKLFREGQEPPVRGTMLRLPDNSRMLYTRGYVPFMRVYPGARVPRPIDIRFEEVDTSHDKLSKEILSLTRMNWNSAGYASHLPMTLEFARQVKHILKEIPAGVEPQSRYLYYM